MNAIFFIAGASLSAIVLLSYSNYLVRKHSSKSYAQGYLVGVGLKNKTDEILKEVM